MTTTTVALTPSSIELSAKDRHTILENVLATLQKRFYSPEKLNAEWLTAVDRHRPMIESAASADIFEQAVSDLLAELHTSHLGFFHRSARRASSRAAQPGSGIVVPKLNPVPTNAPPPETDPRHVSSPAAAKPGATTLGTFLTV